MTTTLRIAAAGLPLTLAACAPAATEPAAVTEGAWAVDTEASRLSYVSVKAGDIAETNVFETVTGSVSADGAAVLEIDLASVETGVDIRNERMRDIFFNVAEFPSATVSAQIDPAAFEALAVGESVTQPLEATLSLRGVEAPVTADVTVTRAGDDRVLVVSNAPVILEAGALELTDGLAQLQELAGLPSITPAVPVTFAIAFER